MDSGTWAIWLVIAVSLAVCLGIFIWFAIDSYIPNIKKDCGDKNCIYWV